MVVSPVTMEFHGIPPDHQGIPRWPGLPPWNSTVARLTMESHGKPGPPWNSMVSPATMEIHGG